MTQSGYWPGEPAHGGWPGCYKGDMTMSRWRWAGTGLLLLGAISLLVAWGSGAALAARSHGRARAAAASFNCDATAVQATLLTAPSVSLGTANVGAPTCTTTTGTGLAVPTGLGLPLSASALSAQTSVGAGATLATSSSSVANLGVASSGTLVSTLTGPIEAQINAALAQVPLSSVNLSGNSQVSAALTALGAVPVIGPSLVAPLANAVTVNAPTLQAELVAVVDGTLPALLADALSGQLVSVQAASSTATAKCVNGAPQLSGSSQITGVTALGGLSISLDGPTSELLNLLNTQELDTNVPAAVTAVDTTVSQQITSALGSAGSNPALSGLVATLTGAVSTALNSTLTPILQQALTALAPTLNALASLKVQPDHQTVVDGQLTQQALLASLTIAGQNVFSLVLGQARVSDDSVGCGSATGGSTTGGSAGSTGSPPASNEIAASQQALACTTRKLVLINVVQHDGRVDLLGAADKSLEGKHIRIVYLVGHKTVATPLVQSDGFFQTTAPLPPAKQRSTDEARYQAVDAKGEKSLDLKLERRMIVVRVASSGGRVRISGRVILPLASPVAPIDIERRVSCSSSKTVTTVLPSKTGSFSVLLAAPPSTQAATYRARTMVRKNTRNPKRFFTFTLPQYVALS